MELQRWVALFSELWADFWSSDQLLNQRDMSIFEETEITYCYFAGSICNMVYTVYGWMYIYILLNYLCSVVVHLETGWKSLSVCYLLEQPYTNMTTSLTRHNANRHREFDRIPNTDTKYNQVQALISSKRLPVRLPFCFLFQVINTQCDEQAGKQGTFKSSRSNTSIDCIQKMLNVCF